MNVSDLLQDSPSQHRRRPPALQHESPPPTQSATPSASRSPPSQHPPQHAHTHTHPSQPPPVPQAPYPPQPTPYYPPHPFSRPDPPPMHRITPRPQSQSQHPIDPTPAMASLQHPSPSAPPPHVHPHTSWGPPAPRQGSSPLAVSNLGPGSASLHTRTSHHHQPPAQIKPAMPGSGMVPHTALSGYGADHTLSRTFPCPSAFARLFFSDVLIHPFRPQPCCATRTCKW